MIYEIDYIEKENPSKAKSAQIPELKSMEYRTIGGAKMLPEKSREYDVQEYYDCRNAFYMENGTTIRIRQLLKVPKPDWIEGRMYPKPVIWLPREVTFWNTEIEPIEDIVEIFKEKGTRLNESQSPDYSLNADVTQNT